MRKGKIDLAVLAPDYFLLILDLGYRSGLRDHFPTVVLYTAWMKMTELDELLIRGFRNVLRERQFSWVDSFSYEGRMDDVA